MKHTLPHVYLFIFDSKWIQWAPANFVLPFFFSNSSVTLKISLTSAQKGCLTSDVVQHLRDRNAYRQHASISSNINNGILDSTRPRNPSYSNVRHGYIGKRRTDLGVENCSIRGFAIWVKVMLLSALVFDLLLTSMMRMLKRANVSAKPKFQVLHLFPSSNSRKILEKFRPTDLSQSTRCCINIPYYMCPITVKLWPNVD